MVVEYDFTSIEWIGEYPYCRFMPIKTHVNLKNVVSEVDVEITVGGVDE